MSLPEINNIDAAPPRTRRLKPKLAAAILLLIAALAFVVFARARKQNGGAKLAEVDGQIIYDADLEKTAGKALSDQRQQLYQLEKRKLEEYVNAVLLTQEAARNGITVAALLERDVYSKVMAVGDDETEAFYRQNQSRLGMDPTRARGQIRDFLRSQKIHAQTALYVKALRSKAKIESFLKAPRIFRVRVPAAGAPFQGAENAPVTIVTFEDYQCPFCKQVQPLFASLLSRYPGKIKLVHKDFPLDAIHPHARRAAEASRCAEQQGKFWPFHDVLYRNAPDIGAEKLGGFARQVGLDLPALETCLASPAARAMVQQDAADAAQLEITGTPTLFINGREIEGTPTADALDAAIEEELAAAKTGEG